MCVLFYCCDLSNDIIARRISRLHYKYGPEPKTRSSWATVEVDKLGARWPIIVVALKEICCC